MAEKDTYVAIGGMGDFGSEDGLACVRHTSRIQKHGVYIYILENIAFILNIHIIPWYSQMYIMIYIYVGTNMTCYLCCFSKAAIVFAVQFPRWQHRCAYPFWVMSAHRQISQTPWVFLRFPAWVLSQRVDSLRRYNPCNLELKSFWQNCSWVSKLSKTELFETFGNI